MHLQKIISRFVMVLILFTLFLHGTSAQGKDIACYKLTPNELTGHHLYTEFHRNKSVHAFTAKLFSDEAYYSQVKEGKTEEMLILNNGLTLYRGIEKKYLEQERGPMHKIAWNFVPAHAIVSKIEPQDVCNNKNNGKFTVHIDERNIEVNAKFRKNRLEYEYKTAKHRQTKGFIGFTRPTRYDDAMSLTGWSIVKEGKILNNNSFTNLGQLRKHMN